MHSSSSSSSSSSIEIIDADAFSSLSADPNRRRADAAADADSAPLSRSIAERVASSLRTQDDVDAICNKYGIPKEFAARPAGDLRACSTPPPGAICVYAQALEAGMRVPLHAFVRDVLRHFGLAPSQIAPNGWRIMAGFVVLCRDAGVAPPSLAVFRSFFKLCMYKVSGWYHFRGKETVGMLFTGLPTSNKGWKKGFLFLSSTPAAPWQCQVRWGGPPSKIALADPVLTGEEKKLVAKLLDAHRAPVDLRTYLTESNLAAAFSPNLAGSAASPQTPPSRVPAGMMDPSVFEMMKRMRAEKVKIEPGSDTLGMSPLSGKKRKFEEEANIAKECSWSASGLCSPPPGFSAQPPPAVSDKDRKPPRHVPDKHDGDTADWKAARKLLHGIVTPSRERQFSAAKPSDVIASSYVTLLQAANYASFSFDYALELEEKLRAQEHKADAMREELERKAASELAAVKAAAVQEYLRSDEHRRELAAYALEGYERGVEDMKCVALRLHPRLDAAQLVVPPGQPLQ